MEKNFFDFTVQDASGNPFPLKQLAGKPVLVVNVASKCGFTPQYAGLEELHKKYGAKGLQVIGFPCNQFGGQEPGTDSEIQQFCQINYGVSFPVLAKVDVNGSDTAPVYEFMKSAAPGVLGTEAIKWNFTKFLIGRDGKVLDRFAPQTKPEELSKDIEKALG
ncbi:MAG: glutathione peroxidase [Bdellovibrionaceae bacterium]|nr:glutathione peroxidase [Pseudobdellovibrionaceae bacterium]